MIAPNTTIPFMSSMSNIENLGVGSFAASRSAIPGEGGYGFESNVRLRSNRSLVSHGSPPTIRPSTAATNVSGSVAITDTGYVEAQPAREYRRARLADLPRLVIPDVTVKPRTLLGPDLNGADVQKHLKGKSDVDAGDQRSQTKGAAKVEEMPPVPIGPRPLRKILAPEPSSYVRSSVMSISAPATPISHGVTIDVSTSPYDDGCVSSTPLASSIAFPISRHASESAHTIVSVVRPGLSVPHKPPGHGPARYRGLNPNNQTSMRIRAKSISTRDTLFTMSSPSTGLELSRFSVSTYMDHHASPTTTSIDRRIDSEDSVIMMQTVSSAQSIGRSGGNGKTPYHDHAHAHDARWLARTSAVPPTASSLGAFELVQIPQLSSRFSHAKES
jgi:hypothetical protein